ncbi:MAG: zinc-binding dehydrogenase [Deltaproteobacteria bacterium]|nr:zinc-binding dehydrogenase [Deltaproteobacteria bacterium]
MKSIAAVLTGINEPLQIEELLLPALKRGQALIEVAYSGICHSQLNEIHGLKGEDKFIPHTLGHEGSGIVLEAGPDVAKVRPGDRVVLTWIKGMGYDAASTQYLRKDGTVVNSGAISTFLTHANISENRLVPITEAMPLKEAALLGCALPTGAGIVRNRAKMQPGESLAVFGLGGIGLSAILMASCIDKRNRKSDSADNPSAIIAIDINEDKLSLAREIGASHTINALVKDPIETIMEITSGQGVHYAVEAAGIGAVMEQAFRSVRDEGGLCILAGNLPQGETISIDPFDLIKGKQIVGTWGGETDPDKDIPFYEKLFLSNAVNLKPLVHSVYPLYQINEAIKNMEKGQAGRCLIRMEPA